MTLPRPVREFRVPPLIGKVKLPVGVAVAGSLGVVVIPTVALPPLIFDQAARREGDRQCSALELHGKPLLFFFAATCARAAAGAASMSSAAVERRAGTGAPPRGRAGGRGCWLSLGIFENLHLSA